MSKIKGGVSIAGFISPMDSEDEYPSHIDTYGLGGFMCVDSLVERDAIPAQRRKAGMMVSVARKGMQYILEEDLTTWTRYITTFKEPYSLTWVMDEEDGWQKWYDERVREVCEPEYLGCWWFNPNGDNTISRYRWQPLSEAGGNKGGGWGWYQDPNFTPDGSLPIGMVKDHDDDPAVLTSDEFKTLQGLHTDYKSVTDNIYKNMAERLWRMEDGWYTHLLVHKTGNGYYILVGGDYKKVDQANDPEGYWGDIRITTNQVTSGRLPPSVMPTRNLNVNLLTHASKYEPMKVGELPRSFPGRQNRGEGGLYTNVLYKFQAIGGYTYPLEYRNPVDHPFHTAYVERMYGDWDIGLIPGPKFTYYDAKEEYDARYWRSKNESFIFMGDHAGYLRRKIKVTGVIRTASDIRLKQNIELIDGVLDKVDEFRGVTFKWKNRRDKIDYGVIAQELLNAYPILCEIEEDEEKIKDETHASDGYYSVKYEGFHSIVIQGIKEIHSRIKENQKRIDLRDIQIKELKELINE